MEEKFNLNQLLQKPIAMMTGEELCFLITKSVESTEVGTPQTASKGNYYRRHCPSVRMQCTHGKPH
jgi:hypothetical protein